MTSLTLSRLQEAWSWRELDVARCRALIPTLPEPDPASSSGRPASPVPHPDAEERAAVLVLTGYTAFREARPAEALEAAGEALALLGPARASLWYSRALNVRSCAQLELAEFGLATVTLREQLRASRDNGDLETEGAALHDLGVMHTRLDPDHAEGYLLASRSIFERTANTVGQAFTAWSLGELRERQGRAPQAMDLYGTALQLATRCGHRAMQVLVLSRLGERALQAGNAEQGERWLRDALARQSQDPARPLWITVPPLVHLLIHTGRLAEAREVLEMQLQGATHAGMRAVQSELHALLCDVHEALGAPLEALAHLRRHVTLYRQENADEQARKVRALEVLHRTELAEREAHTHRQRSAELQAALNELEALHLQLEKASATDELTGVHNRHHLMTAGVRLLESQPQPANVAVAILDIDHFKRVNDTYGHDGGDRVLRAFAQFLKRGLRPTDLLARFGGEEFVVLFPGTLLDEAHALLDALRRSLTHFTVDGLPVNLTVSFTAGVVNCPDGQLLPALHRADQLLYRGKRAGRGVVERESLARRPG